MSYGAVALSDNFQGPSLSKLSTEIASAKSADVSPQGQLTAGQGMLILFADMRDSLFGIVENTLKTNELLERAVLGTPEQQRDAGIAAEDRDPAPEKEEEEEEKGPGFMSRLGQVGKGFLGSLIGKAAITGLALLATYVFEDEIIEGVGNFMKYFGEDFGPQVKQLYDDTMLWWDDTWEGVKTFFTFIQGMFTGIKDYVMQFDTRGAGPGGMNPDGKIDQSELQDMVDDLTTRLSDAVSGFVGNMVTSLIQAFTIYTVTSFALKKLMGMALLRGAPLLAIGGASLALGVAALGVAVAAGVWTLADNAKTAYEDAVTDELGNPQNFSMKEFVTRLLVGKETGNKIVDVMNNAYDKMLIGAATGITIGAVSGGGLFSLPAAGFGGIIGALSGLTVGALTAYYGDEAVEKQIDNMFGPTSPLMLVVDYIESMYTKLILTPFEFIFGKLGTGQDSLFSKMMIKLGADYSPKETPETFLGLGMADDVKLYGENIDPDNIKHLSTEELLKMQSDLESKKANLERTKSIFGFRFGDGYMDTHEKRGIFKELDAIETVLANRDITALPPDNISTGKLIMPQGNDSVDTIQSLMDIQAKAKLEKELDGMIDLSQKKINSENVIQENNNYSGQSPYPFLSQGYISGVTN